MPPGGGRGSFFPYPQQRGNLPPIQRCAAGGEIGRPHGRGVSVPTDRGKRGQDTKYGFLSPLDSPDLPWDATPFGRASKMRGAHSDVWCSKIQHLMEAELFAAIVRTPCTVWPRTVMRGKSRKVNSGHNSVPKPARRTEPSPRNPRFAAHLRCVSAKEGEGSQEGTGNHTWCPVPFCLRRQTAASPFPSLTQVVS